MNQLWSRTLLLFLIYFIQSPDSSLKGQNFSWSPYGDLIVTPLMAYTINEKRSNIPTHFLIANGVKGNIGFELGGLISLHFRPKTLYTLTRVVNSKTEKIITT